MRQEVEALAKVGPCVDPEDLQASEPETVDESTDSTADESSEEAPEEGPSSLTPQFPLPHAVEVDRVSEPAATRANIEETLGTRWAVWVGGLALALGGIFLVRYTIEAGLLGPGVRIALGALFALALAAAGEYVRRREMDDDVIGLPSAYIPGILTAAATFVGFATVYSAYALYGFLGPIPAFILLAACSFGALSASWLHGPSLAALGLLGSYATPALVATESPKAWPLFIYLAVVTGASFFAARLKGWLWLAACATAGAVFWGLLWCVTHWSRWDAIPIGAYILTLMALAAYFLTHDTEEEPEPRVDDIWNRLRTDTDWVAAISLAAITFQIFAAVRFEGYLGPSLLLLGAGTLALLACAFRWRNLSILVVWAALLFGAAYSTWHIPSLVAGTQYGNLIDNTPFPPPELWTFLGVGAAVRHGLSDFGICRELSPFRARPLDARLGGDAGVDLCLRISARDGIRTERSVRDHGSCAVLGVHRRQRSHVPEIS